MIRIRIIHTDKWEEIYPAQTIYESSFPLEEKVAFSSLTTHEISSQCKIELYAILNNEETIGMVSLVIFPSFTLLFYLAIMPSEQGKGIGEQVLSIIKNQFPTPIILEVEYATERLSERRIKFYTRNGFKLNTYPYTQPALHPTTLPLDMHIMSYPNILVEKQFAEIQAALYMHVYKV